MSRMLRQAWTFGKTSPRNQITPLQRLNVNGLRKHPLLLFGHGIWGSKILETLINLGQDVTVIEPSPGARHNVPAGVSSLGEVPSDLRFDAAIIATPATTHLPVAEALLSRGFTAPIFVEKPFADSSQRARRLAALAPGKIFVLHTWRYHSGIQKLRDLIASQILGEATFVESRRCNWTSPRRDVDTVWNLAPHDLSIYLALFGQLPTPVAAITERVGSLAVGMSAMFEGNPPLTFAVSNRFVEKVRSLRVHFQEGVVVFDAEGSAELQIARGSCASLVPIIERLPYDGPSALENQFTTCLRFLEDGPEPPTSAQEGVAIVEMLEHLLSLATFSQADPKDLLA